MVEQPSNQSTTAGTSDILSLLSTWAGNFQRNTSTAFAELRTKDYIRLVIIIGSYCLLRPYLMKLGAKMQERAHEQDAATSVDSEINPNDLRSGRKKIGIPELDSESEEENQAPEPADWGKRARVRQRKFLRQKLEEHEQRLQESLEEEEDKDIAEFLVD